MNEVIKRARDRADRIQTPCGSPIRVGGRCEAKQCPASSTKPAKKRCQRPRGQDPKVVPPFSRPHGPQSTSTPSHAFQRQVARSCLSRPAEPPAQTQNSSRPDVFQLLCPRSISPPLLVASCIFTLRTTATYASRNSTSTRHTCEDSIRRHRLCRPSNTIDQHRHLAIRLYTLACPSTAPYARRLVHSLRQSSPRGSPRTIYQHSLR